MANEYNGDKIVLRDTSGTQMSLPRFFQLALVSEDGSHTTKPTSGLYRNDDSEFHGGWDIGTSGASDVPARTPTSGTAVYVGEAGGFGPNLVIIKEDNYERYHYFGHMASASVTQGSTVQQGDIVGIIGGYGGSSGNWNPSTYAIHLHYEIMTKNFKVSGGTSGDKKDVLDPMDVFDDATLPSGWLFGYDPQTKPSSYAAKDGINNWDYIELDKDAVDFGPPGGAVAAEPFFTDKYLYDISYAQTDATSSTLTGDSSTGGLIMKLGQANSTTNIWKDDMLSTHLKNANANNLAVGFYFYWNINPDSLSEDDITTIFKAAFQYLTEEGVTPQTTNLGIWLDYEGKCSEDNASNGKVVAIFNKVGTDLGYPVVGLYTYKAYLQGHFNLSDVTGYPFWYSRPGASRDDVDNELSSWGFTQAYLWQDGFPRIEEGHDPYTEWWSPSKDYVHKIVGDNWVDNDTLLQAMPVVGSGGGGGGGGGSYTEVIDVTVEVVPPKRIYFSPVPGLIKTKDSQLDKRNQEITISTDAEGADLYYTIDGSSPYQYTVVGETVSYELSSVAIHYENPVKIFKDTHIRVIAVPAGTTDTFDEPLAKGSGTFLFKYQDLVHNWEAEKKAYATSDDNASFFEENLQAFLRLHATQTDEEILYAGVYKHDKEVTNEDAKDNATSSEGTQVISEEV